MLSPLWVSCGNHAHARAKGIGRPDGQDRHEAVLFTDWVFLWRGKTYNPHDYPYVVVPLTRTARITSVEGDTPPISPPVILTSARRVEQTLPPPPHRLAFIEIDERA